VAVSSPAPADTAEIRPRALALATATPAPAMALTGAAGVAIAMQAYLNGKLSGDLGSVELASIANNGIGLVALLALAIGGGSLARASSRIRGGARLRPWYLVGGACGAVLVVVTTTAAPKVGVALLTVALVCGQTTGSLVVDASGIGPAGRRPPSVARLLGVALAIVAVTVSALGSHGDPDAVLLSLAVVAGVLIAIQQATNGRLAVAVGEPTVAALVNFAVGFVLLGVLTVVAQWGEPIHIGGSPFHWIGGLLGAFFVLVTAAAVRTLGVVRLILVAVAGQTLGALAIDLVAPVPGETVGVATVTGVVLTLIAVAISGRR
jgi:transporter family-2 protein